MTTRTVRSVPMAWAAATLTCLAGAARAHAEDFSVLYSFEAAAATSFASPSGSQPDTRPVLGPGNSVLGMTYDGGTNGNGVIYRYDLDSHQYIVLHTFGPLDANGYNADGASPGVALTRGDDDVFYGMASYGGANGNGTIFKITAWGEFKVLYTFSALDANAHNPDGANPLRTIIIGHDGNLYGTTRLGGENTCGTLPAPNGCGVAWMLDRAGKFHVVHQFVPAEGHAASLTQAHDGFLYGCAVWPATSLPSGAALPSGILYRMAPSGQYFETLYTFSQTNANGQNADGADCYQPLVERHDGEFYGAASNGGPAGNGVIFRYSVGKPGALQVVHAFSVTTASGDNSDGALPNAQLTLVGEDLYSTASYGGAHGNGVVFHIGNSWDFEVLHTFSAVSATTGANTDGATPDYGVIWDPCGGSLIGMTDYGGNGSSAGFNNSGGTLYRLKPW